MFTTSKPCSTAQRRPARSTPPLPVKPAPSTRTLMSSQSGASDRTIPAHAVPWPQRSPSVSSSTITSSSGPSETATECWISPTSGWPWLDAAVEDADAHALPGRSAPRPVARDLARPLDGDLDRVGGSGGKAPGRTQLLRCFLLWLGGIGLGHGVIVRLLGLLRRRECALRGLGCGLDERSDVADARIVVGCAQVRLDELGGDAGAGLGEDRGGGGVDADLGVAALDDERCKGGEVAARPRRSAAGSRRPRARAARSFWSR